MVKDIGIVSLSSQVSLGVNDSEDKWIQGKGSLTNSLRLDDYPFEGTFIFVPGQRMYGTGLETVKKFPLSPSPLAGGEK